MLFSIKLHLTINPFIEEPKGGVGGDADNELPRTTTLKGVVVLTPWYVPLENPKNEPIPLDGIMMVHVDCVVG